MIPLGIALVLLLLPGMAILAVANMANRTKWWLCPQCWRWFNQHGQVQDRVPWGGDVKPTGPYCPKCRSKHRMV